MVKKVYNILYKHHGKNGNLFIPQTNPVLSYLPSVKIYNRFVGNWNQNRRTCILF